MKKFTLFFSMVCILFSLSSVAEKVTGEKAGQVAINFFYERVNQYQSVDYQNIKIKSVITESKAGTPLYYYVNLSPGGFVIVSAEDAVIPVLGYSFEGEYSGLDMPENFAAWMGQYGKTISYCIDNKAVASKATQLEWKRLFEGIPDNLRKLKGVKSVQPLITSNWDQGKYYNRQCPPDALGPDDHTLTGCVATALGQIMYYYRWPGSGVGSYTYTLPNYGTLSANFAASQYDWNNMQNQLFAYNDGVAELLYHLGVSVDMNYGPYGSGMNNHKGAYTLRTYFKYLPTTQYVFRDSTNLDWDSLVIVHLYRGQILYYAGWSDYSFISGHAFVCDGYQDSTYCHFNWGWSSQYNGYFYLNALNPGGSNFNLLQELIINIYPDTTQYNYPEYCQGTQTVPYLRGTVEDGSGPVNPYQNNAACQWLIDPQVNPDDSVSSITLSFQQFDTEAGQDILTVYDGPTTASPVLGTFSGNSLPAAVTSTTNKILLAFNSNSSITGKGWMLSYTSNPPDYCSNAVLLAPSGTVSDGSGSKHYNDNTLCTWTIQPPNASGLKLSFTDFHTEPTYDFLEVYDLVSQDLLGRFWGDNLPPELTAPSGAMYLVFKTNALNYSQGWTANYTVTNLGLENKENPDELQLYPNPTHNAVFLSLASASGQDVKWEVLNSCGQMLLTGMASSASSGSRETILLGQLSKGFYWIRILTEKGMITRKISLM
ncbi:MAG: C10 family peptidase [Bacteroidetes bacterium]|nr:C10 family peptidase [Bacteroidota bacterium]